jgi:fatty-acyl-CoA synthase
MQDFPLTITAILRHGATVYRDSECVTWTGASATRVNYAEVGTNAERLAAALSRLGVREGDRVATFAWNNQEHLEAYFAIPCMGAVLHTLNIRLFPEQLTHIVNHAEDRFVIVDGSLIPLLARVAGELKTVEAFIVIGDGDASALGDKPVLRYHELIAAEEPGFVWPEIDERAAAAMCYTSGTTGDPKGVVYSHRSTFLHAMGLLSATAGHRADVPRQCLGPALRGLSRRRHSVDAGAVPAARADRSFRASGEGDRHVRGADHLAGAARLRRKP